MNSKLIKKINHLKGDPQKQLKKLVDLYKDNKFTITNLIEKIDGKRKISLYVIHKFAVILDGGKEGIPEDTKTAHKLFVYAAKKGHGMAMRNAGENYLEGTGTKRDISKAITILEKGSEKLKEDKKSDANILLAKAHLANNDKTKAQECLREAIGNKDSCDQKEVLKLLPETLKSTYTNLNQNKGKDKNKDKDTKEFVQLLTKSEPAKKLKIKKDSDVDIKDLSDYLDVYETTKEAEDITELAVKKEFKRQIQTEKHYLAPGRTKEEKTREVALKLQNNRLVKNNEVETIVVSNIPARRMITAELSVMQASLTVFNRGSGWYDAEFGWVTDKTKVSSAGYKTSQGNEEKVQLGAAVLVYRQKTNPHCNHLGDYFMTGLGTYLQINVKLNGITGTSSKKEKKLAGYMLRYSKEGKPITLDEVREIKEDATADHVTQLNRIFYHCSVKEVARWMLPKDASHELPLATAQIRAVKLIQMGCLKMAQVFGADSDYGVFTGNNIGSNISALKEKIKKINSLYIKEILMGESAKHAKFFKKDKDAEPVTTRERLHKELQDGYGGDSDTDGEGYDSDTANKLYP